MMDTLITGLVTGGGTAGLLLFMLKGKLDDLRTLEKELEALRVEVAKEYVSVRALEVLKTDMDKRFDKLESLIRER